MRSLETPDSVDMPLEVPAVQQLRKDILFKSRNSTAVETEPKFKDGKETAGEHHIADAEGRGNRAGKGIQINHIPAFRHGKKRVLRLAEEGKFRFIVILYQKTIRGGDPAEIFPALGNGGGDAAGETAERGDMQHGSGGVPKGFRQNPVLSQRTEIKLNAAGPIDLFNLGIGGRLDAPDPLRAEQLHNQSVEIFRTGADHQLVRLNTDSPVSGQITAKCFAELGTAGIRRTDKDPLPVIRKNPTHDAGKRGERETVPDSRRNGGGGDGLRKLRGQRETVFFPVYHIEAAFRVGFRVSFFAEQLITVVNGDRADTPVTGHDASGGQAASAGADAAQDFIAERLIERKISWFGLFHLVL